MPAWRGSSSGQRQRNSAAFSTWKLSSSPKPVNQRSGDSGWMRTSTSRHTSASARSSAVLGRLGEDEVDELDALDELDEPSGRTSDQPERLRAANQAIAATSGRPHTNVRASSMHNGTNTAVRQA